MNMSIHEFLKKIRFVRVLFRKSYSLNLVYSAQLDEQITELKEELEKLWQHLLTDLTSTIFFFFWGSHKIHTFSKK